MTPKPLASLFAILALGLTGCAGLDISGIGGDTKFACKAPAGVACLSLSGIHANASVGNLPGLQQPVAPEVPAGSAASGQPAAQGVASAPESAASAPTKLQPVQMAALHTGMPLRTEAKVMRIWMAPYEDRDAALHDQRYVYVTVNHGQWMMEATRASVMQAYRPVFRRGRADSSDTGDATSPSDQGRSSPKLPGGVLAPQQAQGGR